MGWLFWLIYLAEVADTIHLFAGIFVVALMFALPIVMIAYYMVYAESLVEKNADNKSIKKLLERLEKLFVSLTKWFVIFLILIILVPSKQTLYYMAAAKAVDVVSQTEEVKKIVPKSVEFVEAWLNKRIKELKEGNDKKAGN